MVICETMNKGIKRIVVDYDYIRHQLYQVQHKHQRYKETIPDLIYLVLRGGVPMEDYDDSKDTRIFIADVREVVWELLTNIGYKVSDIHDYYVLDDHFILFFIKEDLNK